MITSEENKKSSKISPDIFIKYEKIKENIENNIKDLIYNIEANKEHNGELIELLIKNSLLTILVVSPKRGRKYLINIIKELKNIVGDE